MTERAADELLEIAGVGVSLEEAVDALQRYPRRTPVAYDLAGEEIAAMSAADLLRRTRKVSSRLSERALEAMVERAADAPHDDGLHAADLADMRPSDESWAAADRLYLHFLNPKIRGVGFAKVHKYLHLLYPTLFPILDSRVRKAYRAAQHAVAGPSGLEGRDNWRRRTWLVIGADVRANREDGALQALRTALEGQVALFAENSLEAEATHIERLLRLSDLRLLDMLTWKAHANRDGGTLPGTWGWPMVEATERLTIPDAVAEAPSSPGVLTVWSRDGVVGVVEAVDDVRQWLTERTKARIARTGRVAWFQTTTVEGALVLQERLFNDYRPPLNSTTLS